MKPGLASLFVAIAFFALQNSAEAQSFGIEMGTPLNALNINEDFSFNSRRPGHYFVYTVPKPHSKFDTYQVVAGPQSGACQVIGYGKNDQSGTTVRADFDAVKTQLETKYGKGEDAMSLKSDAQWTAEDDWFKSILAYERSHSTYWTEQVGTDLNNDILAISLIIAPLSDSEASLVLMYSFKNWGGCDIDGDVQAASDLDAL